MCSPHNPFVQQFLPAGSAYDVQTIDGQGRLIHLRQSLLIGS
jgi:hypothetical protein